MKTAILRPRSCTDNECTVEVEGSLYTLYRSETGYVMESDGGNSYMVAGDLTPTSKKKALNVPMEGSLIFHMATALTKHGFCCLLRGDAGE